MELLRAMSGPLLKLSDGVTCASCNGNGAFGEVTIQLCFVLLRRSIEAYSSPDNPDPSRPHICSDTPRTRGESAVGWHEVTNSDACRCEELVAPAVLDGCNFGGIAHAPTSLPVPASPPLQEAV